MIEAMRLGAYDYVTKPLDLDEIVASLQRAAEQRRLSREAEAVRQPVMDVERSDGTTSHGDQFEMLGVSRAMRDIFKQIGRLSAPDATLLITRDSATRKYLVA